MATKVKPTRLQVTGTPQAGDVPMYVDADNFQRGAGGGGGGNVKSFTLSSTSDLTTAQEAYDWYDSGKVAIIIYNDKEYLFDYATAGNAYWSVANEKAYDTVTATGLNRDALQLAISSDTVTTITATSLSINDFKVLRTDKDYGTPYTPQYDGSPATKKYVDDGLSVKADTSSLGTAASKNTGTSSGNVPVLDSNGKLATTTLPGVALTDTFTVTNKADLTSLSSAEQGDIGIVTSENKTYVLSSEPYSTAANWKELLTPTDAVTSVNGQTGAVTLDADDISDSTTTNKFVTATDKSTWSGKQDALTLPATPTQGNLVTWGANNKSLVDGGAVPTGVPSGGNNGDVLTNVSGTPTWSAPSGGDVMVSSQSGNILTSGMKIWAGLETDYTNLGTYDGNTVYLII